MTAEPTAQDAGVLVTFRESPTAVKAVLGGVLVNQVGTFLNVFLVLFITHRGFTAVQAGAALSAYGAGGVAGVVVGTTLADRLGARWGTVLSMAGRSVLILGILYVRDYPALVVLAALVGMIGLVYQPASAALLSELTPKNRQVMVFALYRLALNIGSTVAPLLGAALILVSYNLLFWGEAVTSMGYAVIALAALPPRTARHAEETGSAAMARRWALGAVFADRRYVLFLVALLINATIYIQYASVLPLAMRAGHLAVAWYAFVIAMNATIVITCELLMTKLTQRWPARVVAFIGFALFGFGQALYSVPAGLVVFIGGTLIWTLAEITAGPTMLAYPANAGPLRLKSQYVGTSQAVFTMGFAIGPALGVLGWHLIGSKVWWLCGAASFIGLALVWYGMRPAARAENAELATARAQT